MRSFSHNLAQINIKSKLCHPVEKYQTRTSFFFQKKGFNKKFKEKAKGQQQQDVNIPGIKETNKNTPLLSLLHSSKYQIIVVLKLDSLMTQQRRIHFLNMWVLTDKLLFSQICGGCVATLAAYHSTKGYYVHLDNKLGNKVLKKYCEHMKRLWVHLRMFSRLTTFLLQYSNVLQKLKLKRTDCYSSAAKRWKDVGVAARLLFSTHQVSWIFLNSPLHESAALFQFISCTDWLYLHCLCSVVSDEYLFTSDKRSWNITMASLVFALTSMYSLSWTSYQFNYMAFIVLLRVHVLAQCRSSLKIYKIHGSLGSW